MGIYSLGGKTMDYPFGNRIEADQLSKTIEQLKKQFVKDGQADNILIWNSFKIKPRLVQYDNVKSLNVPNTDNLFFYLERQNEMYITKFNDICKYVDQLEPWEEIDAYIFDDSFKWVIAITHEENLLLVIGL